MKNDNKFENAKCTACGACGKSYPSSKGFSKLGQFLCPQCVMDYEICDHCGKIIRNSHVWTFEEEEDGSYCTDCMGGFACLADLTKEEIIEKLEARHIKKVRDLDNAVCIVWTFEDILTLRPDLTRAKAMEILRIAKHRHEETFCVMSDLLDTWADELNHEPLQAASKKLPNANTVIAKSLSKREFLATLQSCVDDHRDNLQYADDVETQWRNKCIGALERAIKELDRMLPENAPITLGSS